MKKIFFLLTISLSLFADFRLDKAEQLKLDPKTQEEAADLFFQLSLEGSSYADVELGKLYIYGTGIPQNCQRGIIYLLNGATAETPNYEGFLEASKLFENGICVKKSEEKALKYKNLYEKKKGIKND